MNPLKEEIEKVMALDAKRTPGEWMTCMGEVLSSQVPGGFIADCVEEGGYHHSNVDFIASAPAMVGIIRSLVNELKVARDALKGYAAAEAIGWRKGEKPATAVCDRLTWLNDLKME